MATEPTMSLELFEGKNEKNEKKVYAVSESDFVDVLLSFLTMPIGTIILLIGMESKIGGISTLYGSVEGLKVEEGLLQTKACKKMLLHPKNASEEHCKKLTVNIDKHPCSRDCCAESDNAQRRCVAPRKDGVFVEPKKRFILSDDLQVSPFDEKTKKQLGKSLSKVNVGKPEVLDLLKYSLLSKTPLTDMLKKIRGALPGNSAQVSVKLTVNKSKNKVVYAEGGEEFADLLFSFLAFPLGFVAKFFGGDSGIKCWDFDI